MFLPYGLRINSPKQKIDVQTYPFVATVKRVSLPNKIILYDVQKSLPDRRHLHCVPARRRAGVRAAGHPRPEAVGAERMAAPPPCSPPATPSSAPGWDLRPRRVPTASLQASGSRASGKTVKMLVPKQFKGQRWGFAFLPLTVGEDGRVRETLITDHLQDDDYSCRKSTLI